MQISYEQIKRLESVQSEAFPLRSATPREEVREGDADYSLDLTAGGQTACRPSYYLGFPSPRRKRPAWGVWAGDLSA